MKNPSPYLKMRVFAAIDFAPGKTCRDRIQHVSGLSFLDEDGLQRQFTWRTISTWFYRFKKYGLPGIKAKPRSDKGSTRKVSPEELERALDQVLPLFQNKYRSKFALYRASIEKGFLSREAISPTSFYRFIRNYELLKKGEVSNKKRLAFSMQFANQLWQADTLFGPYLPSTRQQTKLIAFIDDASRVVCHGEFFISEDVHTLVGALRAALYKRGVPEALYVDNGSIYSSKEIILICARLGCLLQHAPVRDGAAKGKIERFFLTVRNQFLIRKLDLSSLDALNRQFIVWLEDEYNSAPHSAIGMRPIDRFGLDLSRIRFLPPCDAHDELFWMEESRKVKKDNTFSLQNRRYEAPRDFRDKTIQVRFDRVSISRVAVFYKNEPMGDARPLDAIANGLLRRNNKLNNQNKENS